MGTSAPIGHYFVRFDSTSRTQLIFWYKSNRIFSLALSSSLSHFSLRRQATAMILLDFGDSTGQRKSLDKTVAYRCIFCGTLSLFCDDPPVSVVYSVVSSVSSTIRMRSPIHRMTGTAMLLPKALYRAPSGACSLLRYGISV